MVRQVSHDTLAATRIAPRLGRYSCGSRGSVALRRTGLARPFLLHCCGMIGFLVGLWRLKAAEVGWLSLQSGATWQAQPAVVAPPSIGSVVDRFPAGCAWWVVPQSLRSLTSNPFPSPRPMPKISPWLSTMLSTMAPEGDWPSTWEWRQ